MFDTRDSLYNELEESRDAQAYPPISAISDYYADGCGCSVCTGEEEAGPPEPADEDWGDDY